MVHRQRRFALIGLLAVLLVASGNAPLSAAPSDDKLALAVARALALTNSRLAVSSFEPHPLQVVKAQAVQYPELTAVAYAVKVLDHKTNTLYAYWFDELVQPTSESALFAERAAAYEGRYGRLSPSLHERLNSGVLAPHDTIPVAIWAEQPIVTAVNTAPVPNRVYLPLLTGSVGTPLEQINRFLSARGYAPTYSGGDAPVVYASLPASIITELQAQPYVAGIYEQQQAYPDTNRRPMSSAARTSAAPWTWSRGITGAGVKVAVLEDDGIAFDSPYLDGSQYFIGWWQRIGDHATNVAGVIASDHAEHKGIAYDAELLSANALTLLEGTIAPALDWAVNAGADVINASFGTRCPGRDMTSLDKLFDWYVWHKRKVITVSAGNRDPLCETNYNVSSPGKAYNVITVGAKDDKNTATTEADVGDDQFSDFSRYIDPSTASESRLKPEIVAVGERINTTSPASPWLSGEVEGTSFAAPIVAGEAALMMQRTAWLKYSPEAVKAGVMVSARWTYLHDDANFNQWASVEKMGVGAIDTTAADNSLINNRVQELYLHQSDFTSNHYDIPFDGLAGQRIRVIITWSSHPGLKVLNWVLLDRLESDFDLTVEGPAGQIYGSYADEANYEIVEFVAPQTGAYRARLHLSRWDNASAEEKIGFAWYSGLPVQP